MSSAVQVDPLADPRWDAYVRAHPRWTVYQLVWAGELPSVHLGRCHRIRARDYEAYVAGLGAGTAS